MGKAKTLDTQKKFSKGINKVRLKKNAKVEEHDPFITLADEQFIGAVIMECLKNNDPEGVIEAIKAHLDAVNKLQFSKKTEIPRSTLYYFSKSRNPTLKTLARVVHELSDYKQENEQKQLIKKTRSPIRRHAHC